MEGLLYAIANTASCALSMLHFLQPLINVLTVTYTLRNSNPVETVLAAVQFPLIVTRCEGTFAMCRAMSMYARE